MSTDFFYQIFYLFWANKCQSGWGIQFCIMIYFSSDFFQMIPHEKCNKSYSKHFFLEFTNFVLKGSNCCDFAGDENFLFFIWYWCFFRLIPLKELRQQTLSCCFWDKRGQIGGWNSILNNVEKFDFHLILMEFWFSPNDSLWKIKH